MTNVCSPEEVVAAAPAPLERYLTLQTGLDLLDQGLSIFDRDLRLVAWNKAYVRLLDFPEEMAYLGAPFESFIGYNARRGEYGPGDPDALVAERVAAARTFKPHEIERVRPDGRVLRIRGEPVPGHGFVTLYLDVTEQRRAEHIIREHNAELEARVAARTGELQRSEERVRLIMDSIPALVAYFDRRRVYAYLNRGYRDWFLVDTARPECASAKQFLGESVYAVVKPHVLRALAGETRSFEYELFTHEGQRRAVRTSLVPDHGPDGSVAGCFELTFDITEEKRSQALLARAHKLESLGHLTGGLAHDFNNILTVVIGNLAALADERPGDPALPEYVEPALEAARRGADLVRGLLSFARRQPLQAAAVHVGALVETVARLVRRSLPETLRLEVDVGDAPLWTWIDATLLEQALLNLVLNARDASGADGCISLRARAAHIDATVAAPLQLSEGDCVRIEVEDHGSGMDEYTLAHLFEPFFTTKAPGRGTGLGMAVVYGFIKQSGGAIDVRSAPGRGTTVTVWLPAAEPPAPEAGTDEAGGALHRAADRGLALLVDDDAQVRRAIRRSLLELGYVVLEADSGPEALKLLANTPGITLLLSDVVLGGEIDGSAVAQAARMQGQAGAVVLMSGNAPGDLPRLPGIPLLTKPFTSEQLARAIEEGSSP
ncbi:PAS-domain containing protein [Variovorax sp. Sphag1AA]|uniref:hybrid sensor histidine kinase/response regulator n=1 Tax=Variovorax sp. Sphag1AA TaxID=2587027 RepID=UPI00162007D1|nr:PAS-domain containing protein [Variovorax sp. Sphag1AA]MBB3178459.1 signal transduction histidine kinase [Variovorax sp. Sphag1AA]